MRFIATKNLNKTEDKHPEFRMYKSDDDGNMITEEYTNKDGEKKEAWKSFGAIWVNKGEDGKMKSMTVMIDDEEGSKPLTAPTETVTEDDLDF